MRNLLVVFLSTLLLAACATSPLGRSQFIMMPESQAAQMGVQAFSAMKRKTPISRNPSLNAYVECVAGNLTRAVGGRWEVVVFEDPEPNAFALPGGKIGVQTGILRVARTQDQLAAVLAHELTHVMAHHSAERLSQSFAVQQGMNAVQALANPITQAGSMLMGALGLGAKYGILMPYGRVQESEADLYGLQLMAKAGFDPRQSVRLWQNMEQAGGGQPPEFLSTHPSHATRIQDLQRAIPQAMQFFEAARRMGNHPWCG